MNNTRARHLEILTAARAELARRGGSEAVDELGGDERRAVLRQMYSVVVAGTDCHYATAKSNVAKALRLDRGERVKSWGGPRPNSGRPPKEHEE